MSENREYGCHKTNNSKPNYNCIKHRNAAILWIYIYCIYLQGISEMMSELIMYQQSNSSVNPFSPLLLTRSSSDSVLEPCLFV